MYSPGDTLYLVSQSLLGSDLAELNIANAHAALDSPGHTLSPPMPTHIGDQQAPLIYQMRITHAYTPFTMSPVCRVRLMAVYESPTALAPFIPIPTDEDDTVQHGVEGSPDPVGPEYVLKLYDHRCCVNIRNEYGQDQPYSLENARAYHKYHQGPPAPYFTESFSEMPGRSRQRPWTESDLGLFEAWMEVDARRTFDTEVAAYNILADLQGDCIPKVYDTISCSTPFVFQPETTTLHNSEHGSDTEGSQLKKHHSLDAVELTRLAAGHRIYGILMEFVPGVSLRSFIRTCLLSRRQDLREHVASIANEAVAVVLRIGRYPIVNRDVRLDNMLVRQSFIATLGLGAAELAGSTVRIFERETASLSEPSSPQVSLDNRETPTVSRCIAIDFGQSRFRYNDETDEQWRCAKLFDDEESAMADALAWQMRESFKDTLGSEQMLDEESLDLAEQACGEEQEALWSYKLVAPWYRKLSPEEQKAYDEDPWWGQHPRNRSHE